MQLQDGKKKKVISMYALLRIGFVKEMSVSSRLEIDSCKVNTPECKTKCSMERGGWRSVDSGGVLFLYIWSYWLQTL